MLLGEALTAATLKFVYDRRCLRISMADRATGGSMTKRNSTLMGSMTTRRYYPSDSLLISVLTVDGTST